MQGWFSDDCGRLLQGVESDSVSKSGFCVLAGAAMLSQLPLLFNLAFCSTIWTLLPAHVEGGPLVVGPPLEPATREKNLGNFLR